MGSCMWFPVVVLAVWTFYGDIEMVDGRCGCFGPSCASLCVVSCRVDCTSCCRCCIYFEPRLGKRNYRTIGSPSVDMTPRQSMLRKIRRDAETLYSRTLRSRHRQHQPKLRRSHLALDDNVAALRNVFNISHTSHDLTTK